jgi:hypothetical protein
MSFKQVRNPHMKNNVVTIASAPLSVEVAVELTVVVELD